MGNTNVWSCSRCGKTYHRDGMPGCCDNCGNTSFNLIGFKQMDYGSSGSSGQVPWFGPVPSGGGGSVLGCLASLLNGIFLLVVFAFAALFFLNSSFHDWAVERYYLHKAHAVMWFYRPTEEDFRDKYYAWAACTQADKMFKDAEIKYWCSKPLARPDYHIDVDFGWYPFKDRTLKKSTTTCEYLGNGTYKVLCASRIQLFVYRDKHVARFSSFLHGGWVHLQYVPEGKDGSSPHWKFLSYEKTSSDPPEKEKEILERIRTYVLPVDQ